MLGSGTLLRCFPGDSQRASWLCSLYGVMENAVLQGCRDHGPGPPRRPRPGALDMSIHRRGGVVELGLAGDLDMATAPRLGQAMAWLQFSRDPAATIVIDTTDLDFVAAAGYRALQAALVGPAGRQDPRIALIVGPAVARLEAAISAASTRRPRRRLELALHDEDVHDPAV
jgi:anti-anti-sigma factor